MAQLAMGAGFGGNCDATATIRNKQGSMMSVWVSVPLCEGETQGTQQKGSVWPSVGKKGKGVGATAWSKIQENIGSTVCGAKKGTKDFVWLHRELEGNQHNATRSFRGPAQTQIPS